MLILIKIFEETESIDGVKKYLQENSIDLANNNSIEEVNGYGLTALHLACDSRYLQLAEFLLEQGANPNCKNKVDWTPLHLAASHSHVPMMDLLLKYGANPHVFNNNYQTPLDLVKQQRNSLYYHPQFKAASLMEDYKWIIEAYEAMYQIVKTMEASPKNPIPPDLKDFKTLTQEGMAIPNLSELNKNDLYRYANQLQLSFLHTELEEKIQLPINYKMSAPQLIEALFKNHPGMMIGESHEFEAPKRFVIENINLLANEGVRVVFLEHLCVEECGALLESYLTSGDDTELPEPLKTRLYEQDYHRDLEDTPYNFTNFVKALKQHNLDHPDKLIRIVLFDTKESYSIMGSIGGTKRELVMNYLAHIAIEKEKAHFEANHPGRTFKYIGFMGETHINTYNSAVGVANYQKIPGILIAQIDNHKYHPRSPLLHPDYRYWMFSKLDAVNSFNPDAQHKIQRLINLLQYTDTLIPYLSNEEERDKINKIVTKLLNLKPKPSEVNDKMLERLMNRLLALSPQELTSNYNDYSSLINKVNQILARGVQSQEEYQELLQTHQFFQSNLLPTRDNQSEGSRITRLIHLYEFREKLFKEAAEVRHLTNQVQNELAKRLETPGYNVSKEDNWRHATRLVTELQNRKAALNVLMSKLEINPDGEKSLVAQHITSLRQHLNSSISKSIERITSLDLISTPAQFSNAVWSDLIVTGLNQVLESERELSELDLEMADKTQERILYPLYGVSEKKRRTVLLLVFQQLSELPSEKWKNYLRYFHLQLSKQQDPRNEEQIKQDINFLLDCENNPQQELAVTMKDLREKWDFVFFKETTPFIHGGSSPHAYANLASFLVNFSGTNPLEYVPGLKTFAMQFLFTDVQENTTINQDALGKINVYLAHLISLYFDPKIAHTVEAKQIAQREVYWSERANLWVRDTRESQSKGSSAEFLLNFYAFAEHLLKLREFVRFNVNNLSQDKINFLSPEMAQSQLDSGRNYIIRPSFTNPGGLTVEFKANQNNNNYQRVAIDTPQLFFFIMEADVTGRYSMADYLQIYSTLENEYKALCQNTNLLYAENQIRSRINNTMRGTQINSPTQTINGAYSGVGLFGMGYQQKEGGIQCLVLRDSLNICYNEIAAAFPELNWPIIDNLNLKLVHLGVNLSGNQFELKLSLQETSSNNAYYSTLSIPPFLATALLHMSQSQNLANLMSAMPVGSIHINTVNDPSLITVYIRHAQGVHQYSLQMPAANILVDQNNSSYQNIDHFIHTAATFYQLPQVHSISMLQLLHSQLQSMNQESNQYIPPQIHA